MKLILRTLAPFLTAQSTAVMRICVVVSGNALSPPARKARTARILDSGAAPSTRPWERMIPATAVPWESGIPSSRPAALNERETAVCKSGCPRSTVQAIRAGERSAQGLRLILIEQDQNLPGHRRGQRLPFGHTLRAVRDGGQGLPGYLGGWRARRRMPVAPCVFRSPLIRPKSMPG